MRLLFKDAKKITKIIFTLIFPVKIDMLSTRTQNLIPLKPKIIKRYSDKIPPAIGGDGTWKGWLNRDSDWTQGTARLSCLEMKS